MEEYLGKGLLSLQSNLSIIFIESISIGSLIMNLNRKERYLQCFIRAPLIFLALMFMSSELYAAARPVYVFSHRANDIDDISDSVRNGSNAIEIDIRYCSGVWKVNHNNCKGSVTLGNWLHSFSNHPGKSKIAALNFDIKAINSNNKVQAIGKLVGSARLRLRQDLLVIYSVGDWDNRTFLEPIFPSLKNNEAVTIDATSGATAQREIDYFKSKGVSNQFFADGSASRISRNSWDNLRHARRNKVNAREVKMVYTWTFVKESSIERVLLEEGFDGILVNDPNIHNLMAGNGIRNAMIVLQKNSNSIRLASRADLQRLGLRNTRVAGARAAAAAAGGISYGELLPEVRLTPTAEEDCVSFNNRALVVSQTGSSYIVKDGSRNVFSAPNRDEANRIIALARHYSLNQSCFVGRPDPSFKYLLNGITPPRGSIQAEDCIGFDRQRLKTIAESGRVLLTDGRSRMMMFPNQREATTSVNLINKYGFSKTCYVGRPGPSLVYMK